MKSVYKLLFFIRIEIMQNIMVALDKKHHPVSKQHLGTPVHFPTCTQSTALEGFRRSQVGVKAWTALRGIFPAPSH